MSQETKYRTPKRLRFVLQIHISIASHHVLFELQWEGSAVRMELVHQPHLCRGTLSELQSPCCVCSLHPYFHRGKHFSLIHSGFLFSWDKHSQNQMSSAQTTFTQRLRWSRSSRLPGKMDPELLTLPQCTQGLVKLSVAIYVIKAGPWASSSLHAQAQTSLG